MTNVIDVMPAAGDDDPDRDIDLGQVQPTHDAIQIDLDQPRRRHIIPEHLRRRQLKSTLQGIADLGWHNTRFHAIRSPSYVLASLWWSLVAIYQLGNHQRRWWWHTESTHLRHLAAATGDSREWLKIHKENKETRLVRGVVLLLELLGLAVALVAMLAYAPWFAWLALALVLVPMLARYGRPEDKPIVSRAILPAEVQPPNFEIITRALGSLGIGAIDRLIKEGISLDWVSDVHRDGDGWGVDLNLPHGVTPKQIIAKRANLASGLRRPLTATWPEGVPAEHEGRLFLWIGRRDISRTKPPVYPLIRAGQCDLFDPVPFAVSPRGVAVPAPMFEVNWLIGASPGQGKTSAVRVLACNAALDPLAEIWIHELAGKGDLEPLAQVCHRYCSGLDDDSIRYTAESVTMLRRELERRSAKFKKLPREAKPDGKLTRELASQKALRLRMLVCIIDELQNLLMHPQYGKQAAEDLAHIIRLGRAYGIIFVLSTQRPASECVPTSITGIVTVRFCLKVPDYSANDLVLGTGSYKNGYDATAFRAKTDAGLGWLKGEGDPAAVRTYYLDLPTTAKVAARARQIRQGAGVLSGYALGEGDDSNPRDVLADVLQVFGTDPGLHWEVLADRLSDRIPDRWAGATPGSVSDQCRGLGVPSVVVKMAGVGARGCRRADVDQVAGNSQPGQG